MGFEISEQTYLSSEDGLDVRRTLTVIEVNRFRMTIQVRKCRTKIIAPIVQMLRSSLGDSEQALIITAGRFTGDAVTEAFQPGRTLIALINGEQLAMAVMEHQAGVHRLTYEFAEIDDEL
jgi:restriction endonuclease Mrr